MPKPENSAMIAAIETLASRFPQCFAIYEHRRRPLKVGIRDDVIAAMAGVMSADEVASALRYYTNAVVYQRTLIASASRIDLDGNPAGTVTPDEEAFAWEKAPRIGRAQGEQGQG
jgi:ProP effector